MAHERGAPRFLLHLLLVLLGLAAIVNAQDVNRVTKPTAGTVIQPGDTLDIEWEVTTSITTISIYAYYVDKNKEVQQLPTVAYNIPNEGSYKWTTPSDLILSTTYFIQIFTSSEGTSYSPDFTVGSTGNSGEVSSFSSIFPSTTPTPISTPSPDPETVTVTATPTDISQTVAPPPTSGSTITPVDTSVPTNIAPNFGSITSSPTRTTRTSTETGSFANSTKTSSISPTAAGSPRSVSGGVIAAGALGGVIGIAAIAGIAFFLFRRRRKSSLKEPPAYSTGPLHPPPNGSVHPSFGAAGVAIGTHRTSELPHSEKPYPPYQASELQSPDSQELSRSGYSPFPYEVGRGSSRNGSIATQGGRRPSAHELASSQAGDDQRWDIQSNTRYELA